MDLSSQGLNFLGLTSKRFASANASSGVLHSIQEKFMSYEQTGNAFAVINVALSNLKNLNCQAFCLVNGKKMPISEKSWERGGILEGKLPLEEGIAQGLYHIEKIDNKTEKVNLDIILEELKKQVLLDEQISEAKKAENFSNEMKELEKFKNKLSVQSSSALGFMG